MLYMKAKNADSCNQCVIAQALSAVAYAGFCLRAGGSQLDNGAENFATTQPAKE